MYKIKTILLAGFVAGTLDAIAAILLVAKPVDLHHVSRIFRFIASGLFGKQAYVTGAVYPVAGLVLHYLIATLWSAIYLLVFFPLFKSRSVWAKTILMASLIWVVMNAFMLPISGLDPHPDGWAMMRSFTVILFCVGLPVCLITEKRGMKI